MPTLLRSPGELAALVPSWRALVAATPGTSYFTTPDWVLGWSESLGRGRAGQAVVAVWRGEGGAAEAVLPLLRTRERLHPRLPGGVLTWTVLGSGPGAADHCGFAVDPSRHEDVRAWLASLARHRSMVFPNLDPKTGDPFLPPGAREIERTACPVMPADPAALGSARHRQGVRRKARRLAEEGVTFTWLAPGTMEPGVFDDLLRLHRLRRDTIGGSSAFDASRRPLHAALAARAAPGRGPCALVARDPAGAPVGILYGFLWQDTFAYYQLGWDPAYAKASLGTVLFHETLTALAANDVQTFDFLRGAEEFKHRFGATDRYDTTWLVARGAGGALLGAKSAARRVRARRLHPLRGES
ncbi:GNAT family N-acetyltransferase [Embleya sp. NBC_00896]|uniref:GNAT family N-acetyltransferase n=1 Tax=Embleya sp. NBC_00896 TaxID=2975961 RepID=UPI00386E7C66|nr:GNAT family N-acetyltransferase [Embleya sp. NBC_00896]